MVQHPPGRIVKRRTGDQGYLGVTRVPNFAHAVFKLVARRGKALFLQLRVPVLRSKFTQTENGFVSEVVTQEMRLIIQDELASQLRGALAHLGKVAGFGRVDLENAATTDLVHGKDCSCHAATCVEERAPAHPEVLGVLLSEVQNSPLNALLGVRLLGGANTRRLRQSGSVPADRHRAFRLPSTSACSRSLSHVWAIRLLLRFHAVVTM